MIGARSINPGIFKFSGWLGMLAAMVLAGANCNAAPAKPEDFVISKSGNVPIIISVPHGGRERKLPGKIPERSDTSVKHFNIRSDFNTDLLAKTLMDELEAKYGISPYYIEAKFHRSRIDANRDHDEAYESQDAKPLYEAYHGEIRKAIRHAESRYASVFLLDIHGQAKDHAAIYRGTQNGATTKSMAKKFGADFLYGADGLLGQLLADGYKVLPDAAEKRETHYKGGYTVTEYGVGKTTALQLEIGRNYRKNDEKQDKLARDMAKAIAAFHRKYLAED